MITPRRVDLACELREYIGHEEVESLRLATWHLPNRGEDEYALRLAKAKAEGLVKRFPPYAPLPVFIGPLHPISWITKELRSAGIAAYTRIGAESRPVGIAIGELGEFVFFTDGRDPYVILGALIAQFAVGDA